MRCRTTEPSKPGRFDRSNRLFSVSNKADLPEIGRVRFAADLAQRAPCARVPKGKGGGGVCHD